MKYCLFVINCPEALETRGGAGGRDGASYILGRHARFDFVPQLLDHNEVYSPNVRAQWLEVGNILFTESSRNKFHDAIASTKRHMRSTHRSLLSRAASLAFVGGSLSPNRIGLSHVVSFVTCTHA